MKNTLARWAEHGLITSHAYNGHYYLNELPKTNLPQKQCGQWNQLIDRVAARKQNAGHAKTFN